MIKSIGLAEMGPCRTATGSEATFVVVDDPIGCVVPSEGVKIVGRIAHHHGIDIGLHDIVATRIINDGPDFLAPIRASMREMEPKIKGPKKPKQRKLLKGRP